VGYALELLHDLPGCQVTGGGQNRTLNASLACAKWLVTTGLSRGRPARVRGTRVTRTREIVETAREFTASE
jgi:hypothetical protein